MNPKEKLGLLIFILGVSFLARENASAAFYAFIYLVTMAGLAIFMLTGDDKKDDNP